MNSTLNMLFRLAISQGLTNKEAFVEKVAEFLQEKMGQDEINADKYGKHILDLLENFNEQLLMEQIFKEKQPNDNTKLEKQIEELTKAIHELNKKIDLNPKAH